MTDDLESNPTNGSAGSPNSAVSEGKDVQRTSTPDASKQLEQLDSVIAKAVERALQSQKDKRISSIEKEMAEFKPVLERVKSILTPEQLAQVNAIQKDAEFEELKQTVTRLTQTGVPATGNQQNTATDEAQRIFQKFDVDMNDPAAVPYLSLKGAELVEKVAELALSKSKQPTLDSSAATSLGSSPAPKAGLEALTEKYQKDMLAARGNRNLLAQIKAKAIKDGVPVDTVVFV